MNRISGARAAFVAVSAGCCTPGIGAAAPADEFRVDRNAFVTMRDGTRLATDLYLPAQTGNARAPVVLIRTPYGKDTRYTPQSKQPTSLLRFFVSHGYAVAVQDKRGRHLSEGTYIVSGGTAFVLRFPAATSRVGSAT